MYSILYNLYSVIQSCMREYLPTRVTKYYGIKHETNYYIMNVSKLIMSFLGSTKLNVKKWTIAITNCLEFNSLSPLNMDIYELTENCGRILRNNIKPTEQPLAWTSADSSIPPPPTLISLVRGILISVYLYV